MNRRDLKKGIELISNCEGEIYEELSLNLNVLIKVEEDDLECIKGLVDNYDIEDIEEVREVSKEDIRYIVNEIIEGKENEVSEEDLLFILNIVNE